MKTFEQWDIDEVERTIGLRQNDELSAFKK
jgi:hypothetical protein